MAFLSGSRFTHDLATFDSLLLARRYTAMTVGLKVIDGKRAIMMHMRIKRQHQRRTVLHEPHTRVATAMDPAFVAFGTFEPTFQIHIVYRQLGRRATHTQPRLKTAHHLGKLLVNGVSACLPLLSQRDELCFTLLPSSLVARPQDAIHRVQVLDVLAHLLQGLAYDIEAAVNAPSQALQQRLCRPPFFASRLRSSESRTSCKASLIRKPGGCSGPPWPSLRIPRTAAQ